MSNLQNSLQEWKDIPGYEGVYQASIFGQIRSLPRFVRKRQMNGKIGLTFYKGIVLKPYPTRDGYLLVDLHKKAIQVHSLILKTFVGEKNSRNHVCMHLDDNKKNNRLDNLVWGTYKENAQAAVDKKLYKHGRLGITPEKDPLAKPVKLINETTKEVIKLGSIRAAQHFLGLKSYGGLCGVIRRGGISKGYFVSYDHD